MGIPLQPVNIRQMAGSNPFMSALQIAQGLTQIRAQHQQAALQQQRLQQEAPMVHAHTQLMQAQAQHLPEMQALKTSLLEQQLANPDLRAAGLAGQYGNLEYLRRTHGENSRQYQQLKTAMEQQQHIAQQMADARQQYAGSSVFRALPPGAKKQGVGSLQARGFPVNIQTIMSPEQKAAAMQNQLLTASPPGLGATGGQAGVQQMGRGIGSGTPTPVAPPGLANLAAQQASQTQSDISKGTMTPDQLNRLTAANRGLKALSVIPQLGTSPFKYSGLAGKTKLQIDRILQSNDPTYIHYIADNQAMKAAEQDLALALGVAKTDQSFKRFLPAFDIFSWANNPQVAQAAFNSAAKIMHQEGLESSQNIAQQRQDILKAPPHMNVGAPVNVPKFETKEEWEKWAKSLTSAQRRQADLQPVAGGS